LKSQSKPSAFRFTLIVTTVLLLTACASQTTRVAEPVAERAYQQRHDYLTSLSHWSLSGRLAASDGKEGGSGALTWEQNASDTHMSFRGAMGKGAWELEAVPGKARLRFADGRDYSASTIAQLITAHMRAKVPVDALSWWVLGLARPSEWEDRQLDGEGRITNLRQFGWDVTFSGYKLKDQVWLPGKLVARNQQHTVKLAISDWTLQPGTSNTD